MMIAPATMLTLNGKLDFDFEDMEEIENHPMAAPLMMTFEQLFEGALGSNPNEALKNELDTEGLPEAEPKSEKEFFMEGLQVFKMLDSLIKDLDTGKINVNVSVPSMLVNVEVDVNAPGIKEAAHLAYHFVMPMIQEKLNYMK